MNFWYIFAALTLFAAIALLAIFLRRRRAARRIEIRDTNPDNLAERIAPFIGHPDPYYLNKDRMLDTLGGRPGLRKVRTAIGAINTVSARNNQPGTNAAHLWEKLRMYSWWAFFVGWGAWLELWLRQYIPALPPVITEALLRHYVDMIEWMDTIRTMHEHLG